MAKHKHHAKSEDAPDDASGDDTPPESAATPPPAGPPPPPAPPEPPAHDSPHRDAQPHRTASVSLAGFPTLLVHVPRDAPNPDDAARKSYLDQLGIWGPPTLPVVSWEGE